MPNRISSAEDADAELEARVDAQRMLRAREISRGSSRLPRHMPPMNVPSRTPSETADEPIDQLQQLKPDDLVDQRGAAAADEEDEQSRKKATCLHDGSVRIVAHATPEALRRYHRGYGTDVTAVVLPYGRDHSPRRNASAVSAKRGA